MKICWILVRRIDCFGPFVVSEILVPRILESKQGRLRKTGFE
jgi:hypothetical protein